MLSSCCKLVELSIHQTKTLLSTHPDWNHELAFISFKASDIQFMKRDFCSTVNLQILLLCYTLVYEMLFFKPEFNAKKLSADNVTVFKIRGVLDS